MPRGTHEDLLELEAHGSDRERQRRKIEQDQRLGQRLGQASVFVEQRIIAHQGVCLGRKLCDCLRDPPPL